MYFAGLCITTVHGHVKECIRISGFLSFRQAIQGYIFLLIVSI